MKTFDASQLTELAANVLETAAFACGFGCEKDELPCVEQAMAARVAFSGPCEGKLLVVAPVQLCRLLAANALSLDEDEVQADAAADNLKELANIICGQWLTAEFGDEPVFRLSVPRLRLLGANAWQALIARDRTACLLVEDLPLLVDYSVRDIHYLGDGYDSCAHRR